MRTIHTDIIINHISEMCIEANLHLSQDVADAVCQAADQETSELGSRVLHQLKENMDIAATEQIPI